MLENLWPEVVDISALLDKKAEVTNIWQVMNEIHGGFENLQATDVEKVLTANDKELI